MYNVKFIRANADVIYRAFSNAKALENWLIPDHMTGKIQHFDWREGGGYLMSLFYHGHIAHHEKTTGIEHRHTAKLIAIKPAEEIVMSIRFDTQDPQFSGDMMLIIRFESKGGGTDISFLFKDIPTGISFIENKNGTQQLLDKLALYVEQGKLCVDEDSDEINEQESDGSANAFQWK
ncbi:MAG: SRPBCC domain-containing protein [Chitinophagaceae bacterium]|nr:SRPBCC domain-containing protein [Chitinophagaceae bacterium]